MKNRFIFLEHTSDVEFEAFGEDVEEIFIQSANALRSTLVNGKVAENMKKKIVAEGKDKEQLLTNFLNELIFLFDSEQFLISCVERIKIVEKENRFQLTAEIQGDLSERYEIKTYVKAATYFHMKFKEDKNNIWSVRVVLDV